MYGISQVSPEHSRGRLLMRELVIRTEKIITHSDNVAFEKPLDAIHRQLKNQIKKLFIIFNREVELHIQPNQ